MTIRKWTLKDGREITAKYNEPGLDTWNGEAWVSCTHELKIMQPKPLGKAYLQAGLIYGGSNWREVFKKARTDITQHGSPTAQIDQGGRLIISDSSSTKPN